ncbi:calmodulin, putative [Bodo saltans]|uniref:Calmodulin, putative n=1 Tax=Bodo saltans TaxID=75058 RepID=A0A0S4IUE7_BODSA|nr:calmodulin, putative [Bodo saltans]|eukprot:CUF96059.1 calmodulin, putative [Bodo saltans]
MSTNKEWIDTWNLFDEKKTGSVSKGDFKHIVRSLGRKYTEAEFNDLIKDLGDPITQDRFVEFMKKPYSGPTEDDLRTALQAFDGTDTGLLKLSELTTLLTSLGEKMPEADVKQLLAEVKVDAEGRVSIEEFAKFLCTPVPSMTPDIAELQKQLAQS